MSSVDKIIAGLTTIGIITALFSSDRQTTRAVGAAGGALQGLYKTVITGK